MLKDLLSLVNEESTDFLYPALLFEQIGVLELGTVRWVVSHEVLSQEDAWVEPGADAGVDFIYIHKQLLNIVS